MGHSIRRSASELVVVLVSAKHGSVVGKTEGRHGGWLRGATSFFRGGDGAHTINILLESVCVSSEMIRTSTMDFKGRHCIEQKEIQ